MCALLHHTQDAASRTQRGQMDSKHSFNLSLKALLPQKESVVTTIITPSHSKMRGSPKEGKETYNEGHSEENKSPEQAQIPSGRVYHQPLTGYAMPPSYQYHPLAQSSEPPVYYYPPPQPPPPLSGQYHAMPHGYSYGPQYYPMPPPQGYFYPPVTTPSPNVPQTSPSSSANDTKTPISDEKMNKPNKDPVTRNNNIPLQSSSTSTDEEFLSKVKPMRSDFFIFASEHKEQVLNTLERKSGQSQVHLITELNEKLLNMWENLDSSMKTAYKAKEEEDRIRFMHEDEIESRHCATLTSRVQNAKSKDAERTDTNEDGDSMQETKSNYKRGVNANNNDESKGKGNEGDEAYESPPKKSK